MPIYEYRCEDCDRRFEELVRSEKDRPACPSCSSRKLQKLFSVVALNFGAAPSCGCGAGG